MYSRAEEFGGTLFSHAVSVMTDLIHHEPQSFRQLQEAGLPDAFLAAVKVWGTVNRAGGTSSWAADHSVEPVSLGEQHTALEVDAACNVLTAASHVSN